MELVWGAAWAPRVFKAPVVSLTVTTPENHYSKLGMEILGCILFHGLIKLNKWQSQRGARIPHLVCSQGHGCMRSDLVLRNHVHQGLKRSLWTLPPVYIFFRNFELSVDT